MHQRIALKSLFILMIPFLIFVSLKAQDGATQPEELWPERYMSSEPLPFEAAHPLTSYDTPQIGQSNSYIWSRVVYQSFANNNWDIFYVRGDGNANQLTQVTNHINSDVQPNFNADASRIVFSSNRNGAFQLFAVNPDGSNLVQLTATQSANDLNPAWSPDGSKIVFQSNRTGQSEIYVMNANGTGQTRLTFSGEYNGMPTWSPTGNKIAFISYRNGGYRVWVMNSDGSSQTQLSAQPYSANPAWSPDGTRIAYDADTITDGYTELWLMNSDGTGQQMLHSPYGGQSIWARSWSPDSAQIAVTAIRHDAYYWYQAYVLAYDLSSATFSSFIPSNQDWNPDWQTRDPHPPTSQVAPMAATSPNPMFVSWHASDTGLSGLATVDVQVKQGANGSWVNWLTDTTETSGYYTGTSGQTYYFRSRAKDNVGNVEAWPATYDTFTTIEALAPVSSIQALPPYSTQTGFMVRWGGYDPGDSGIKLYDVQYRDATSGTWNTWFTNTTYNAAAFTTGQIGHTYQFRVRATDWAGNVEAWPAGNGDSATTLYNWSVQGVAYDNAGVPVIGATVATQPNAGGTVPSDNQGRYGTYIMSSSSNYAAAASASGFGAVITSTFPNYRNAWWNLYLPPADNLIHNGGFETGTLTPEWQTSGTVLPVATSSYWHSGNYAAYMGQPSSYSTTEVVGSVAYNYSKPQIVLDAGDQVHFIYAQSNEIYYRRRNQDGSWTTPQNLSNTSTPSRYPTAILDKQGMIHVAWAEEIDPPYNPDIYYVRRATNGSWSTPQNATNTLAASHNPILNVDSAGIVYLVWSESFGYGHVSPYYVQRALSGSWTTALPITTAIGYQAEGIQAILDSQDNLHVMWAAAQPYATAYPVYHRQRDSYGQWSEAKDIANNGGVLVPVQAGADAEGHVHILLQRYDAGSLYYSEWGGSGWSVLQQIATGEISSGALAVDVQGAAHVTWSAGSGINDVYYLRRDPRGAWSTAHNLSASSGSSSRPQVAVDGMGRPVVLWIEAISNDYFLSYKQRGLNGTWSALNTIPYGSYLGYYIEGVMALGTNSTIHVVSARSGSNEDDFYYHGPLTTPTAQTAAFSQAVTIPVTMTSPVVSFLYDFGGVVAGDGSSFQVKLTTNTGTTTLLSSTQGTNGWQQVWFNVSPWVGQTITLTFQLNQTANRPVAWVYVEEISLGTAAADLVVDIQDVIVPPGETFQYALTYENAGGGAGEGVVLTNTLPAGITFISASIAPTVNGNTLIWNLGTIAPASGPQTIVVTVQVDANMGGLITLAQNATIAAANDEHYLSNNTASGIIDIRIQICLPLIFR